MLEIFKNQNKPPDKMTAAQAAAYYSKPYNPDGIFKYISGALHLLKTPLEMGEAIKDSMYNAGQRMIDKNK